MTGKYDVSPLLAILVLEDAKVHVSTSYSNNMTSYIEVLIDQSLDGSTTLEILYINLDYGHIRFQWYFDCMQFWGDMNVVKDITNSIILESIGVLVLSMKYRIPRIFRYDLD